MIYSDNFVCFFKHVTQVGALKEIPDFLFLHLIPEAAKISLRKIQKISNFTLSECKYIPTLDMRGEGKAIGGIK